MKKVRIFLRFWRERGKFGRVLKKFLFLIFRRTFYTRGGRLGQKDVNRGVIAF